MLLTLTHGFALSWTDLGMITAVVCFMLDGLGYDYWACIHESICVLSEDKAGAAKDRYGCFDKLCNRSSLVFCKSFVYISL